MEDEDGDQTLMPRHRDVHNTRESGIGSPVFPVFFAAAGKRGGNPSPRFPIWPGTPSSSATLREPPGPFPDSAAGGGNRDRESGSRFGGPGISWSDVIVTSELHSIVRLEMEPERARSSSWAMMNSSSRPEGPVASLHARTTSALRLRQITSRTLPN
jgi:hypothetical protein